MAKLNYKANYKFTSTKIKGTLEVSVDLYSFIEDGIHYLYCPQLDINGYGKSESEAKKSFRITMEEFFRYTINKNSLGTELKRLGWKHTKKRWLSPELTELLKDNENFNDILHKKEYKKTTQSVQLAEAAC